MYTIHCNQSPTLQHEGGLMFFCILHENFFPHVKLACAVGSQGELIIC